VRIATLSNASAEHTRRWVAWFRARGHEVRVWSLEAPTADLAVERLPSAPLPGFLRYPLALPALERALERFEPDLVDAHYVPNYGLLGALAGRRPLSVTAWGSDLLVAGGRGPLERARTRYVMGRADLVLADAEILATAARALGAAPGKVHVIPWGVDPGRFRPAQTRERGLLVSTRMHEPVYDLATVLRAAKPVLERHPRSCLVVAGDGSLRAALESQAAALLPAGRWRFAGRLGPEDLAALLLRSDVYLSASRSDSTSVSLLEAMAAGAVPVVSDIDGNREWVAEGDGARLFPCGDGDALERAIERVLNDPAWAAGARARNLRVVGERADWHRNLARIEALFAGLVDARCGGRT
jgi:glycosyltransferase involved in cell wall biosynthesis